MNENDEMIQKEIEIDELEVKLYNHQQELKQTKHNYRIIRNKYNKAIRALESLKNDVEDELNYIKDMLNEVGEL